MDKRKERIEVVDHSQNTFSMIYDRFTEDFRLTAFDRAVYLALKYFAKQKNVCWPSGETIAQYSGCSRSTAFKALAHIEELGYITRTQRKDDGDFQKTTVYHLLDLSVVPDNKMSPSDGLSVSATETLGVRETDAGCPPHGHELDSFPDSLNKIPPVPPIDELPDESPLPEESDPCEEDADTAAESGETDQDAPCADAEVEEVFERCTSVFPGLRRDAVQGGRLRDVLREWIAKLGTHVVMAEAEKALRWQLTLQPDEKGRMKKPVVSDAVAFYDDWLKRCADDANFEKWWGLWPGVTDGYESAKREWRERLRPLKGQARAVALHCLFDELERLSERAAAGAEIEYLPRARSVIRDAKLDAAPEVRDDGRL